MASEPGLSPAVAARDSDSEFRRQSRVTGTIMMTVVRVGPSRDGDGARAAPGLAQWHGLVTPACRRVTPSRTRSLSVGASESLRLTGLTDRAEGGAGLSH